MSLFIHKKTGEYLLLIKTRKSGVNTFLQVDKLRKKKKKKREWSCRPEEQRRLIKGFTDLICTETTS